MIEFPRPFKGRFLLTTGDANGDRPVAPALIEMSSDGKQWRLVTKVANDATTVSEVVSPARYMRIVYVGGEPIVMEVRKLLVSPR